MPDVSDSSVGRPAVGCQIGRREPFYTWDIAPGGYEALSGLVKDEGRSRTVSERPTAMSSNRAAGGGLRVAEVSRRYFARCCAKSFFNGNDETEVGLFCSIARGYLG